jgi:hypothetical protein
MKCLYKYPQAEFPYSQLVDVNRRRYRHQPERIQERSRETARCRPHHRSRPRHGPKSSRRDRWPRPRRRH